MIEPNRFIAQSSNREAWLAARSLGVTATMVSLAATPAGFKEMREQIINPQPIESNAYMDWGSYREPYIADMLKDRYGIMPNEWLISKDADLNRWQMATPDGLSLDHKQISEIKTSGNSLEKIPIKYMRQIQWQLYVTDANSCLFAWELRHSTPTGFEHGLDIHTQLIKRNEDMMGELIKIAQQLQEINVYSSWETGDEYAQA